MAEVATSSPCRIRIGGQVDPERYHLRTREASSGDYDLVDTATGKVVGQISEPDQTLGHEVEVFNGKGGLMVTVYAANGLRYFGLPGCRMSIGQTRVALSGEPIISNPAKKPSAMAASVQAVQVHTHQATILGAGLATRFERISGASTHCSKPGVPLAGPQTVIECIANTLAQHGLTHLIVNTYFKPDSVKNSLARSAATEVRYIDEGEPSGTAGGLRKMLLEPQYKGLLDEGKPLLVVQGDSVTDADFSSLIDAHVRQNALVTLGAQIVDEEDVDKFGIIVTDQSGEDGQSGRITGFQEKPRKEDAQSRLGNTGFYIFSPLAYPLIREIYQALLAQKQQDAQAAGQPAPHEVPFDFATDIFPAILARVQADPGLGAFWAQSVAGYWSDIGNPRQYLESLHDVYAGKVRLALPENRVDYYDAGVVYWPNAKTLARQEQAELHGNVIVGIAHAAN